MDGVLVIDKPCGPTSHDVVASVRRAIGIDRVGHTGTLDPMATGVLPLVIGRATRLARFLSAADKEYDAAIRLGDETDTDDACGRPTDPADREVEAAEPGPKRPPIDVARAELDAVLGSFVGTYEQTPPAFSAKKIQGVRAYALARRGEMVAPKAATVTVHRLALVSFDEGIVRVTLTCSPGFYVRALARDLGRRLRTGAHLSALRRVRSGAFDSQAAVPLASVERDGIDALQHLVPMHSLLGHLPALVLTGEGLRRAAHGHDVGPGDLAHMEGLTLATTGPVRLLDEGGKLVAIAESGRVPGFLHPAVVVV
jgi:tRNA pseudouridine55 synthase